MDNTQTKKEQDNGSNTETQIAKNASTGETKPACGSRGGKKIMQ